jgi:hypothetical protein
MSNPTLFSFLNGIHSRQDILNFVEQKMIEQGKPSYDPLTNMCFYRSTNGLKCAIGHLIPDEEYDAHIKGKHTQAGDSHNNMGVFTYIHTFYSEATAHSPDGMFLVKLQSAHDQAALHANGDFMKKFLERIAYINRNDT